MFKKWEEFALGPRDRDNGLHVTLNEKGEIMIGAKAIDQFEECEWAILLFDRWNKFIGVAPSKTKTENAFPLVKKSKGRHRVIRAGRFCKYHGIRVQRTTACMAEIDEEGVLVLDLKLIRAAGK